jgi:hypothetical protein
MGLLLIRLNIWTDKQANSLIVLVFVQSGQHGAAQYLFLRNHRRLLELVE